METINIKPSKLNGNIDIQVSKSDVHRSLVASSFANGISILSPWKNDIGDDITITKNALVNLGICKSNIKFDSLEIIPTKNYKNNSIIDAGESGTSLRFLIPIVASLSLDTTFLGHGRLLSRPMHIYSDIWKNNNLELIQTEQYIKTVGTLKSGEYFIDGSISSQFISAMIFALSNCENDSTIHITNKLESKPYIDMTIDTLKKFSVDIVYRDEKTIFIKGSQTYKPTNITFDRDWSHAAFFVCAAAMGGCIKLLGLNKNSIQGDKSIIDIVKNMGAIVTENDIDNSITVSNKNRLTGIDIDISNIPDLAPILSLLGVYASGNTRLYNAKRLKYKESDRINDLANMLRALGAKIETSDDEIVIEGSGYLHGGKTNSYGDHRLAMTASMASIISKNNIVLENYRVVSKSSKLFFNQFLSLGGKIDG